MNHRFAIGDIVVGNKGSNRYSITSLANGFVGEVVDYTSDNREDIKVKVLKNNRNESIGSIFPVNSSWFELKYDSNNDSLNDRFECFKEQDLLSFLCS